MLTMLASWELPSKSHNRSYKQSHKELANTLWVLATLNVIPSTNIITKLATALADKCREADQKPVHYPVGTGHTHCEPWHQDHHQVSHCSG